MLKLSCSLPADADAVLDNAAGAPAAAAAVPQLGDQAPQLGDQAPQLGDQAPLLAPHIAPFDAEAGAAAGAVSRKQWTVPEVAAELQGYLWAVALDFLVTLAVFPGVASSICPSQNTARRPPCTPHQQAGRFCGKHLGLRVVGFYGATPCAVTAYFASLGCSDQSRVGQLFWLLPVSAACHGKRLWHTQRGLGAEQTAFTQSPPAPTS